MTAESIIIRDPQGSSKSKTKNVNSQRSRRNIQPTFDPSAIKSPSENYPRFFIANFEEISSRQIKPYNLIVAVREHTGEQSVSVTNTGKASFTVKCKSPAQTENFQSMNQVQSIYCKTSLHPRSNTSTGLIFLTDL